MREKGSLRSAPFFSYLCGMIQDYIDTIISTGAVFWDEEKYTFEEYERIITEAVRSVCEEHLEQGDGEIEDYDYLEWCIKERCDRLLGNSYATQA